MCYLTNTRPVMIIYTTSVAQRVCRRIKDEQYSSDLQKTYPFFNKHDLLWDFAKLFYLFFPNSCVHCNIQIPIKIRFKIL